VHALVLNAWLEKFANLVQDLGRFLRYPLVPLFVGSARLPVLEGEKERRGQ
jgi:hypothetical protein